MDNASDEQREFAIAAGKHVMPVDVDGTWFDTLPVLCRNRLLAFEEEFMKKRRECQSDVSYAVGRRP